jgi:CRP-like cAMP-binding protein
MGFFVAVGNGKEGGMFINKESDLFKELSRETTSEIAKILVEEPFDKGTVLFKEGDPAHHFYVLMEGRVRLIVGKQGEIDYTVSNSGEAFGRSSLVDRDVYTARAECMSRSSIIKIEQEKLNHILAKHPEDGLKLYRRLAGALGQRLIHMYNAFLAAQAAQTAASFGSGQVTHTLEE